MMDAMTLYCVSPRAMQRADRVTFAVKLLKANTPKRFAVKRVMDKYGVSSTEAYRTLDIASDLA